MEFNTPRNTMLFVVSIGTLAGFLFGFHMGVISGALIFINQIFKPDLIVQEILVSSLLLGALIGCPLSGCLADYFGRRRMLIGTAIIFLLGTSILVVAPNVTSLIIGRLITGIAVGISSYITPLFIAEMAPSEKRGGLVLLNAIAITGGETLSFLIDYLLAPINAWRIMFAAGLIPAILLFVGMLLLPETPRWLVLKGSINKARLTLAKIREPHVIDFELEQIKKNIVLKSSNWKELLSKKNRSILFIGIGLGIFQQFFGINTVMYYGPIIFKATGFHNTESQILVTLSMGIVNTIVSAIAVVIVDRVGRRILLLSGCVLAAISLGIVGLIFNCNTTSSIWGWLTVVSMLTYVVGYCISVGSLFWLIIAEIFPLNVRGLGMSIAATIQWSANFLVSITFLNLIAAIGFANTFWFYGIMCLLCFLFVFYLIPETKGILLEKIECELVRNRDLKSVI